MPGGLELEQLTDWSNDGETTYYMYTGLTPMFQGDVLPLHEWRYDQHVFACYDREARFLGTAGLYGIQHTHRTAEYRIFLGNKSQWEKGHGKRATRIILSYGFGRLNLHSIWLGVNEHHIRARNLYKSVGFVEEGCLRERFFRDGYHNIIRMSILENE
jgi:RimJ/RimL family protein N-acetyltransferase